MSFPDNFQPIVPFANGFDPMGNWPQFPVNGEQFEENSQMIHDHDHMSKRVKSCLDNPPPMNGSNHRSPPVNPQSTGRIFFKTRLCVKFRMGQCKNGENCNFAHGDEDLRKPPPNWQEIVSGRIDERVNGNGNGNGNGIANGNENWDDDDDRIIHKMKLCKRYYNGEECPYGERCNFLHKDPPRFRDVAPLPRFRDSSIRESSAISIGTTGPPMAPPRVRDQIEGNGNAGNVNGSVNVDGFKGNSRPIYWKTRLCTRFETTSFCPHGDKCHYAHGQSDLLLPGGRPVDSIPAAVGNNIPSKPIAPLAIEPNPMKTENGFHTNEGEQPKMGRLNWPATKKINRIYGDWLDDLPLVLPNGTEI